MSKFGNKPGGGISRENGRRWKKDMRINWEELANGIILQAVEDYRKARKRVRMVPDQKNAQDTIRETERFFRSVWFAQLTDLDGERLLSQLKEEIAH
jgi:hypothetical protein